MAYYRQGRHVIQLPARPGVSLLRLVVVSLWGNRTILTLNKVLGCLPGHTSDRFLILYFFAQVFPRCVDFQRAFTLQKDMRCEYVDGGYVVGFLSCGKY